MLAVEYDLVAQIINGAQREKITVVEGAAGAGKTRRLAATREQVEARGGRMLVVTPTRKAAQVAAGEVGTETRAVAKLLHEHGFRWDDEGHWSRTEPSPAAPPLDRRTLLVIDEAGMLDQDSARALLALADAGGAQVALIGDRHQLPAVGRGSVLAAKAARGQLVVADTRQQVARINHGAHRVRVVTGQAAHYVITASGEQIGAGDTIATRQNDAEVGVANRETWTVVGFSPAGLLVTGESGQRVLPPAYGHKHVELAYTTTAYGAQGSTVPVSHVLVGEHTGAASAYVGMTRGRERNIAHLVAESIEDARTQWIEVFGRDRADLGPSHAAAMAAETIDRYGPRQARYARTSAPRRRPEPDLTYRPPAPSSAPGLGL